MSAESSEHVEFDTSDVDRWVGVPLAGGNMDEPVSVNDVRRWVQGMQNPNPLFYDRDYAAESRFGEIVAPQSFTVCMSDSGCGAGPAIQGYIKGAHGLFGGDEWWFYGPRIRSGDQIRQDRMLFDARMTNTGFAGPTLITRGDTTYINQKGEIIAKQRATMLRYSVEEALKRGQYNLEDRDPEWTQEQRADLQKQRFEWIQSLRDLGHERRLFVKPGEKMARCVIGPHSIETFMTEVRSIPSIVWGTFRPEETGFSSTEGADWTSGDAGWLPELSRDPEGAAIDPDHGDPITHGPAIGHISEGHSTLVGLPRRYGFGVSMGSWMLDYITNWGGEWSEIVHSNMQYRSPTFTGDVAFIDGEVVDVVDNDPLGLGRPLATVAVTMSNQDDTVLVKGRAKVRLPTENAPEAWE